MLPLVNEENHGTYSRYLRIRTLDEETVLEAARIFSKFRMILLELYLLLRLQRSVFRIHHRCIVRERCQNFLILCF